jgi:methyl-accepting chemotaxis protein
LPAIPNAAVGAAPFAPRVARARAAPAVPAGRSASAVARWKRQLSWFTGIGAVLLVTLAGVSAAAMWHLISEMGRIEQEIELRSRAAVDARLAVVDVERRLAQTMAEDDPARVRAAAVASIAAASRLEDAVSALRAALPESVGVTEMARLVDGVKGPRVQVIVLARKGERAEAAAGLQRIAQPLQRIDALSAQLLEQEAARRQQAGQDRAALFQQVLFALLATLVAGAGLGLLLHRRLVRRFAPVEQLLDEVAHSARELQAGGQELDRLNRDVQRSNAHLGAVLQRVQEASETMTREAASTLREVEHIGESCQASAGTSRQHAQEAAAVAGEIQGMSARLHQLLQAMQELGRSRSDIARLADHIETISSTTRLLSLNAAVEAARAGAAGRGFSVIASSVRKLSEDTQQAAVQIRRASEDITRQLGSTSTAMQQTSVLMDQGAGRIGGLDGSARANQSLMDGVHQEVQVFRGAYQRQVEHVQSLDQEAQALAVGLEDGDRQARMLDATSQSLSHTSAALRQRRSNLQS